MIAVFLAPIYLFFNYYLLLWFYSWTDSCFRGSHSLWFRIPAAFIFLFFSISPLTCVIFTKDPLHRVLKIIANYWLGMFQYILLIVLLFDAVQRIIGPDLLCAIPDKLTIFGGTAILLVLTVSLYGIFHARQIKIRHYAITIQKSSPISGLKIALAADLHLGYNSTGSHLRNLVSAINAQAPDLVCIAGDFFDNDYDAIQDPDSVSGLLAGIRCPYGVYGCWGNHDVSETILAGFTFPHKEKLSRDPRFGKLLSGAGITLLEDEVICIDHAFYLGGRKDPDMAKKEQDIRLPISALARDLDSALPLIVLDHQPKDLDNSAQNGVDLLLSGHTHDGQTFPGTVFVHFLWENPCGILQKGAMTSVVTSGAGVWGPAMRIGTDNEIVILNIKFQAP